MCMFIYLYYIYIPIRTQIFGTVPLFQFSFYFIMSSPYENIIFFTCFFAFILSTQSDPVLPSLFMVYFDMAYPLFPVPICSLLYVIELLIFLFFFYLDFFSIAEPSHLKNNSERNDLRYYKKKSLHGSKDLYKSSH